MCMLFGFKFARLNAYNSRLFWDLDVAFVDIPDAYSDEKYEAFKKSF